MSFFYKMSRSGFRRALVQNDDEENFQPNSNVVNPSSGLSAAGSIVSGINLVGTLVVAISGFAIYSSIPVNRLVSGILDSLVSIQAPDFITPSGTLTQLFGTVVGLLYNFGILSQSVGSLNQTLTSVVSILDNSTQPMTCSYINTLNCTGFDPRMAGVSMDLYDFMSTIQGQLIIFDRNIANITNRTISLESSIDGLISHDLVVDGQISTINGQISDINVNVDGLNERQTISEIKINTLNATVIFNTARVNLFLANATGFVQAIADSAVQTAIGGEIITLFDMRLNVSLLGLLANDETIFADIVDIRTNLTSQQSQNSQNLVTNTIQDVAILDIRTNLTSQQSQNSQNTITNAIQTADIANIRTNLTSHQALISQNSVNTALVGGRFKSVVSTFGSSTSGLTITDAFITTSTGISCQFGAGSGGANSKAPYTHSQVAGTIVVRTNDAADAGKAISCILVNN